MFDLSSVFRLPRQSRMATVVTSAMTVALVASISAPSLAAQARASGTADPSSVSSDNLPTSYFTLTDTIRNVFGHTAWSRYDTPSACANVPGVVDRRAYRGSIFPRDSADESSVSSDTLATRARALARACARRFTIGSVGSVPETELPSLVRVALAADDDSLARAAANQYFAVTAKDSLRGWKLRNLMRMYLDAHPPRFDEFETMAARLDSVSHVPGVQAPTLQVRDVRHARYEAVKRGRDHARIEKALWNMIRANDVFSPAESVDPEANDVRLLWALYAIREEVFRQPEGAVDRVRQQLTSLGIPIPNDPQIMQFITNIQRTIANIGKPVPPLPADYWFGGTTAIASGKVSVILPAPVVGQPHDAALIRRLHAKYGDAIQITLFDQTQGFIKESPPLKPEDEAKRRADYYRDYCKLPVVVAIAATPMAKDEFGRLSPGSVAYQQTEPYTTGGVILDRQGKLVWAGGYFLFDDYAYETFIDKALKQ